MKIGRLFVINELAFSIVEIFPFLTQIPFFERPKAST
jgi:hypothetical protein